jgi:hypothetical protein
MMKVIEPHARINLLFLGFLLVVISSSCVLSPEDYDATNDQGTYSGSLTVYGGEGSTASFSQRVCPKISATLTISGDQVTLQTTDSYLPYIPDGDVTTSHTVTTKAYANNKFQMELGWPIGASTQLVDLTALRVCESSPPTNPLDPNSSDRGLLQDLALLVGEPGFVGEFGQGTARGSLWYGVRCTDGRFLPLCLYFMQLTKD